MIFVWLFSAWLAGALVALLPFMRRSLIYNEKRRGRILRPHERVEVLQEALIEALLWPLVLLFLAVVIPFDHLMGSRYMKTPRELEREREAELKERERKVAEAEAVLRAAGVKFEIGDEK